MTTFYLEQRSFKAFTPGREHPGLIVNRIDRTNPALNRRFYTEVGSAWKWRDRIAWSIEEWQVYVDSPAVATFVGQLEGREIGYAELRGEGAGDLEIVYFGLLPEFLGQGVGGAFLSVVIAEAWALPGTRRLWLHTCTQDHPHALSNYIDRGFVEFRREEDAL